MSQLEHRIPYTTALDPGLCEAVRRFVPQLKQIKNGTVIKKGDPSLVCINGNQVAETDPLVNASCQVIVKYGMRVSLSQARAMEFVKSRTSVPVPEVLGSYDDDNGCKYIVMEYIEGCKLSSVWKALTKCQKDTFARHLKSMFDELRSIKGAYIGGIGESAPEGLLFRGVKRKGPYKSEKEMNEAIIRGDRAGWRPYGGSPPEAFINCVLPWLPSNHEIVLSHGKLHPAMTMNLIYYRSLTYERLWTFFTSLADLTTVNSIT